MGGGERVALNEVLRPDRGGHRAAPRGRARGGPEGRHEGHLRRHDRGRAGTSGFRSTVAPARRASSASGSGSGGRREARALRRGSLALAVLAACASEPARHRDARSNSDQIIWEAGQKALAEEALGVGAPALQADHRRLPPEPVRARGAPRPSPTATSRRAAPATTSWPSAAYREFLTLYPSHPKSDYAQFQVAESLLQAEERPRPRPDRHRAGARGVPAPARRSTRSSHVRRRRPASRITRMPPEPGPGASSWPGYFYQRTRQACRPASRATRAILTRLPRLREARRGALPAGRVPVVRRPRTPRPCPTWRGSLEEYPEEPATSPRPTSSSRRSRRPVRPRDGPARPRPRLPATASDAVAHKLKCHFRICKKPLDETPFFLLASAQIPDAPPAVTRSARED